MPDLCAAAGIAQLKKMNFLVKKRIKIAKIFLDILKKYNWIQVQKIPLKYESSYWTLAFIINKKEENIWEKFRKFFIKNGGDAYYGAWALSYNEPSFNKIKNRLKIKCPEAEYIQPRIVQLKTNYNSLAYVKKQAKILKYTLDHFN